MVYCRPRYITHVLHVQCVLHSVAILDWLFDLHSKMWLERFVRHSGRGLSGEGGGKGARVPGLVRRLRLQQHTAGGS